MPDAGELPGTLRAVVPLVRAGDAVVRELVAHRLPGLAAVVGALDLLPEPPAGLRQIEPVRIGGRPLDVVDLPPRKVGAADVPVFALSIRRQDERALARADQHSYLAHPSLLCSACRVIVSYVSPRAARLRTAGFGLNHSDHVSLGIMEEGNTGAVRYLVRRHHRAAAETLNFVEAASRSGT